MFRNSPIISIAIVALIASVGCADAVDPTLGTGHANTKKNNKNNDTRNNANNENNQNNVNNANNENNANNDDSVAFPYALDDLPADATAPWPGGIVHGALLNVEHVIDGDTVYLRTGSGEFDIESIRIQGINAPECAKERQANGLNACNPDNDDFSGDPEYWGAEAHQALQSLIEGKDIRLACKMVNGACETDRYDRFLGFLIVDGMDVSEYMASEGHAWTYTQFPVDNLHTYCVAEKAAIENETGMWNAGFDSVVVQMNTSTRNWYSLHDVTCAEYAP